MEETKFVIESMLNFSGRDQKAQQVCLHYAEKLGHHELIPILACQAPVTNSDEALALSRFFWEMVDASIEDRDNKVEVLGELDQQFWMERTMNVMSGYLSSLGFNAQWEQASDEN